MSYEIETSYDSEFGSGDRREKIHLTYGDSYFGSNTVSITDPLGKTYVDQRILNGNIKDEDVYFLGHNTDDVVIEFSFKRAIYIDEFKWIQSIVDPHGVFVFERKDGDSWVELAKFTLGKEKEQVIELSNKDNPSHEFRLRGVEGVTSTDAYIKQIEFKSYLFHRILVKRDNEYWTYSNGDWISVGTNYPTDKVFIEQGMHDWNEFKEEKISIGHPMEESEKVVNDKDFKCFKTTFDLSRRAIKLDINRDPSHLPPSGPGSQELIAGDLERGFYGEVPSSEIISGYELAELVGVTQGASQFSDVNWLKWAYKGKTLFRPKKAIRSHISWDHLNEKNLVYGDRTIEVDGLQYKIRLMKSVAEGYETVEANREKTVPNSEWNHLMLPIHEQAKDASWAYPQYVEDDVPYWGIDYTDKDLHTHYNHGNGTYVWCQEHWDSGSSSRVYRGSYGVSNAANHSLNLSNANRGWAPVLELLSED